ncbi:MAG: TonB family protein, partial [Burkholderiales bacterium]
VPRPLGDALLAGLAAEPSERLSPARLLSVVDQARGNTRTAPHRTPETRQDRPDSLTPAKARYSWRSVAVVMALCITVVGGWMLADDAWRGFRLSKKVTDEADFSGQGVARGIAEGVEGGKGPVPQGDQPYFDFQVDKTVAMAPGAQEGPAYPDILSNTGIEGQVLAQFVVDTTGRADMSTFKALKSDHELFTTSVKYALQRMRFLPAEVGGRKVKQLVEQPFQFSLNR